MYAYDYKQRNLLFFQEDKGDNLGVGSTPSSSIEAMMLSPVYEFNSFQDALDFQGRILDEDVLFDISNIRFIRLAVTGSSERQIDSPRVQLWHQQKSTLRMKEGASFVTSGTSLSSADPERTVLLTSRLVMFLGRAQEFLTLFVTDDTTIKEKGPTTLIFHPTKYGGLDRWKSRKSIRCRLVTSTQGGAAGVRLDKKGLRNEDEETMYTQHKTFEMTFENEQGRVSFIQSWNHVLEARRAERMRLKKIASSMSASTFTGAVATKIIF
ncbi:hypothetical protein MMC25_007188 [Agyrium rufum]|nr:hypothetical protein [Agyrium rufum]